MVYDEPTVSKFKSDTAISIITFMLVINGFYFVFYGLILILGLAALSDSSKLNEQV